ncbi:MAG: hypothetical protein [Wendovervirus sonii]|uniref:LytTR family transcriptional regulator n=1 Tax=phage Lak_Megaphage_Sonny TaxID=3109229 RepID=A0ABZ0Z3C6_9CAUD|nr:MAG: hypothetical protein [phage Lak_Megaphage_Sonny]
MKKEVTPKMVHTNTGCVLACDIICAQYVKDTNVYRLYFKTDYKEAVTCKKQDIDKIMPYLKNMYYDKDNNLYVRLDQINALSSFYSGCYIVYLKNSHKIFISDDAFRKLLNSFKFINE